MSGGEAVLVEVARLLGGRGWVAVAQIGANQERDIAEAADNSFRVSYRRAIASECF